MPELPEVETVRRGLEPRLTGRRLAKVQQNRADLRFPLPKDFAKRLSGRRVDSVERRAKYLLLRLDDGQVLMIHLGMSGRIVLHAPHGVTNQLGEYHHEHQKDAKHDHIVLTTDDGWVVRFNDPRRFGMMDLVHADKLSEHRLIKPIGPEPLDPKFNGAALGARLKGKKTSIKAALSDQRVVAGLGNIYVAEALFRAGISPKRLAKTVQGERADKLVKAIKTILNDAIKAGGSSLRDYVQSNGDLGNFQHHWLVYDRAGKPCSKCKKPLKQITQGGRSTFYCAQCQR